MERKLYRAIKKMQFIEHTTKISKHNILNIKFHNNLELCPLITLRVYVCVCYMVWDGGKTTCLLYIHKLFFKILW